MENTESFSVITEKQLKISLARNFALYAFLFIAD